MMNNLKKMLVIIAIFLLGLGIGLGYREYFQKNVYKKRFYNRVVKIGTADQCFFKHCRVFIDNNAIDNIFAYSKVQFVSTVKK